VIPNAGKDAVKRPSLTVMTMFENEPAALGVPLKRPLAVSNVAQLGRFWIVKPSVPPSGSLAAGVNEYALPAVTEVDGVPLIVGARFVGGGAVTLIAKAGSMTGVTRPSLTPILISE
jgi:hypothetical protein